MQTARLKAESQDRKSKLANSYHELLQEFSSKDLRSVGNYTLGRLIGKGSFGKVYLASHKLTNGSKVVLKSTNKDDSNLAREIHHHRQFIHPHIARLYEIIVTENLVWLVLEYCPGDELFNYLCKHGPLPVEKVQKIFAQLVGAVAYVHGASCVHRDLKLENIMLDKNENVKLCDFGFTREYEGKGNCLQTYCGTVAYSAPEMLKGEKYAGEKVDVWSLGVVLYALLCGELPFDGDDETANRIKIINNEPKWPDHLTSDARSLVGSLLSKRPLLRPSLSDILAHPFLAEHAPQQQAILDIQNPPPFSTQLEKETLQRMGASGVNTGQVIENVLARRCDALEGWWSLLIEKEQRKQIRRERKRKEREAENRGSKRLSGASSRLDRITNGTGEEGQQIKLTDAPRSRGRRERRSIHYSELIKDLPGLPEHALLNTPEISNFLQPVDNDLARAESLSKNLNQSPLTKNGTNHEVKSRSNRLQLVTPNHDTMNQPNGNLAKAPRRKHQHSFISQLAHWKHWLLDSTKKTSSPSNKKASRSTIDLPGKLSNGSSEGSKLTNSRSEILKTQSSRLTLSSERHPHLQCGRLHPVGKKQSPSHSPLTPRGTFRHSSAGLRNRKSTSSSLSSIHSIQLHHHTHSKASSTSSDCSLSTSKVTLPSRSPHHSVKVLPATPVAGSFPSNIRVVRQPPVSSPFIEAPWGGGGLVFAKRKKKALKGPNSSVNSLNTVSSSYGATSHRKNSSQGGHGNGEIIEEEDEDEIEELELDRPTHSLGEIEEQLFTVGGISNDAIEAPRSS
ncbi:hypothetical protein K3495_g7297 [Podosphaera aphanis]|nr:hypothetical protein K3495_g7297 [Podosphaera aphanis]